MINKYLNQTILLMIPSDFVLTANWFKLFLFPGKEEKEKGNEMSLSDNIPLCSMTLIPNYTLTIASFIHSFRERQK